jgi:hypothetical protein
VLLAHPVVALMAGLSNVAVQLLPRLDRDAYVAIPRSDGRLRIRDDRVRLVLASDSSHDLVELAQGNRKNLE